MVEGINCTPLVNTMFWEGSLSGARTAIEHGYAPKGAAQEEFWMDKLLLRTQLGCNAGRTRSYPSAASTKKMACLVVSASRNRPIIRQLSDDFEH